MICASCGAELEGAPAECERCGRATTRGAPSRGRVVLVAVVLVAGVAGAAIVARVAPRAPPAADDAASAEAATRPELYARPLAVDVDGDGAEDMIVAFVVDGPAGPRAVVQAEDPRSGHVFYTIPVGPAYVFSQDERKVSPRVALVAQGGLLGVARVPARGAATLTVHDLRTGALARTVTLPGASGRVCLEGDRAVFPPASTVDMAAGDVRGVATATCPSRSDRGVADAPEAKPNSAIGLNLPFSLSVDVTSGPHAGVTASAASSGAREGWLISDPRVADMTADPPAGADDLVELVRLDLATGARVASRSLTSLGFGGQRAPRVEALPSGALLVFAGEAGIARVDERAARVWARPLPPGTRLVRYTIGASHVFLHVASISAAVHASSSPELAARVLVVDLADGRALRTPADSW